jgi:redox-sensitive bicupin YhaK (pirin superfamily)
MNKPLLGIYNAPGSHWVGDGFPVRTLFSYDRMGKLLSPFLMLDYAGPSQFAAGRESRGVGEHPHRGFETVTIVYSGEVAHRDSAGNGGVIGPGDVQWMTAGSGVLHEEYHSEEFTRHGGMLKMAQLWVNLPAQYKMTAPRYQAITRDAIPVVQLAGRNDIVRVIAGRYGAVTGPAQTCTEMNVFDVRLSGGNQYVLDLPDGHNGVVALLGGELTLGAGTRMVDGDIAVLGAQGGGVALRADSDVTLLALSGRAIDEPIVGYGPFVMNTREEIVAAFNDLQSGKFGALN